MQQFIEDYIFLIFRDIDAALMAYLVQITLIGMLGGLFWLTFRLFNKHCKAVPTVVLIAIIAVSCVFVTRQAYQAKADYYNGVFGEVPIVTVAPEVE